MARPVVVRSRPGSRRSGTRRRAAGRVPSGRDGARRRRHAAGQHRARRGGPPGPPRARRLAGAAVAVVTVTALAGGLVVASGRLALVFGAAHVGATLIAVRRPPAVGLHVATGSALAAAALVDSGDTVAGVVILVAGAVVGAELLGGAGAAAIVVERDPRPTVRRAALAGAMALAVAGLVVVLGAIDGPSGVLATAVAAVGATALVLVLAGAHRSGVSTARPGARF